MATIKSYTDIEQSRKLAEILSLKSADQSYIRVAIAGDNLNIPEEMQYKHSGDIPFVLCSGIRIPCWSLAALLSVIPQEIFVGEYIINITEGCDNKWVLTYDHYEDGNPSYYGLSSSADNLVDACVTMIEKLNERKML